MSWPRPEPVGRPVANGSLLNLARSRRETGRRGPAYWLIVLLGAILLAGLPAAVQSQPAPLTVRPAAGPVGTVFHFRSGGYAANETVSTVVRWPDGTEEGDILFQAGGDGTLEFIWDSRGAVPGRYTATATGQDSGRAASASFTVQ
jgi:hypothetical protein